MPPLPSFFRPALIASLRHGYRKDDLAADVLAGLLVGVVALPLSLALAIASGVRPEQGLWTAVIGGLLISALGGSRMQIGGPAGAFVGLCAAAVNLYGFPGLALATVMAGLLMIFMGAMRLGVVISYIPIPVVVGFTSGIALILASTQIGPALGIPDPAKPAEQIGERIAHLAAHAGDAGWRPLGLCLGSIALIVGLRKFNPRLPGGLIAVTLAALAVWGLGIEGEGPGRVATIASRYPDMAHGLPLFGWPSLSWFWNDRLGDIHSAFAYIKDLSRLALAIGLLGAIESLLSAVVADGMTGHRHDSNTELVGQGIANLVAPFFGCLPATGVIARTSTNIRAGARTPVAGLVHALTVLLMLVALAPLVVHVPLAALAGVLLVVCWYMAELRHWPHILRAGRSDALLLPLAFGLTAFIGLTEAILVGTVLAMFFFVRRMSDSTQIEKRRAGDASEVLPAGIPSGVAVYEVRGPFFFGAATLIRDLDGDLAGEGRARAMVIRLGNVPFIDATAGFALRELHASARKRGGWLLLSDIHTRPVVDLERLGLMELIGRDQVCADLAQAVRRAQELMSASAGQAPS